MISMKISIDHLADITGWIINAPSTISTVNYPGMVAGLNSSSLQIHFDKDDSVRVATKTLTPIDVTLYDTLVLSVWSAAKKSYAYNKPSDFAYKLMINNTAEYYIPTYYTMTDISIGIEGIDEISKIQITPLHSDDDWLYISEMVAEKQEFPYDVIQNVKEAIDYAIAKDYPKGRLIGSITAASGDDYITVTSPYIEQTSVIYIDDGVNSETHQIDTGRDNKYTFKRTYDGPDLLHSYTDANVYMLYPVYYGVSENGIRLPGIAVWGFQPDPVLRGGKMETIYDTHSIDGTVKARTEGQIYNWPVQIDIESKSYEMIAEMSEYVRRVIAGEIVWINGRKHDIVWDGPGIETRPVLAVDTIGKVQYNATIEIIEDINERVIQPITTTVNVTAESEEG